MALSAASAATTATTRSRADGRDRRTNRMKPSFGQQEVICLAEPKPEVKD
jgi:hypothetical protein